jgi:hypothetical protein
MHRLIHHCSHFCHSNPSITFTYLQAYARSLHVLRSLAQLCTHCGTPVFEDYTPLDVGTLVTRIAACMQRYPESITLQTSACALISRLAGCSSCQESNSADLVAAVGEAGAVQALSQAVAGLKAHASVPAAMVCASEALTALRLLTTSAHSPVGMRDLVAEAGGVDLITTAREIAQGQGSSDVHALLLMVQLACRPQSTFNEAITAANAAIAIAQAISELTTNNQHYSSGVRMMWSISGLVENLVNRQDVDRAVLGSFAEHNAAIAVAYLQKDDMVRTPFLNLFFFFKLFSSYYSNLTVSLTLLIAEP